MHADKSKNIVIHLVQFFYVFDFYFCYSLKMVFGHIFLKTSVRMDGFLHFLPQFAGLVQTVHMLLFRCGRVPLARMLHVCFLVNFCPFSGPVP